MSKIIDCTCGYVITGSNDEELLANARRHGQEAHDWPDLPDDDLLAMATPAN